MATSDLTSALDEAGVSYELLSHAHTESALAEAESLGVSPDDVAKTLIVKLFGGLPARSSAVYIYQRQVKRISMKNRHRFGATA